MKPLIGITAATYTAPETGWDYNRVYVACIKAIEDAGGLPVLIPVSVDESILREIYARLDGLLLPGGSDINPDIYGETAGPLTRDIDDARDHAEINLAQWAVDDDLPLLGICRGHQLLNVALGGTLVQDIPSEVGTDIVHDISREQPGVLARDEVRHEVRIDPDSHLASVLGATAIHVNTLHHQAVEKPAPAARVTAFAPDEIIEALELPGKKFALSVQWHPEDMYEHDEAMRRLFRAFVAAAST